MTYALALLDLAWRAALAGAFMCAGGSLAIRSLKNGTAGLDGSAFVVKLTANIRAARKVVRVAGATCSTILVLSLALILTLAIWGR